MTAENWSELSVGERKHFYECLDCEEMVDMRRLDDVIFHEDHIHRPDLPYSLGERIEPPILMRLSA